MGKAARVLAAGFNTAVMAALAYDQTGGRLSSTTEYALWGAVLAAAICAFIIWREEPAMLAWVAIGYILFGGLLTRGSPHYGYILLALALAPMVPRPRGSLALGLGVSALAAFASFVLIALIP